MIHVLPDEVEHCQVMAQGSHIQRVKMETHGIEDWGSSSDSPAS